MEINNTSSKDQRRVLVIDDDEGDCCLIEDVLSSDGIDVVTALGGERGIHALSDDIFPVVVTDLRMPDIDGFGIIDFINKRQMDTLVVVITGYASIDNVIEALRRGAYDYIIKPFSGDLLRLTIKRAFDFITLCNEREKWKYFDIVTQLAKTAAHEVFQPLTLVIGEANEIYKTAKDEEIKAMAHRVLEESRRIRDIVRKMDNLQDYVTKPFPGGHTIIDIEKGLSDKE
ncbi:MAG: response regulator [Deltaproteobacteria bacterium]|nr:response regulator [Deltaproteobacteria bacterium]